MGTYCKEHGLYFDKGECHLCKQDFSESKFNDLLYCYMPVLRRDDNIFWDIKAIEQEKPLHNELSGGWKWEKFKLVPAI